MPLLAPAFIEAAVATTGGASGKSLSLYKKDYNILGVFVLRVQNAPIKRSDIGHVREYVENYADYD